MEKTVEELLLEQVKILVDHRKNIDAIIDDLGDLKIRNRNADLSLMNIPEPKVLIKGRTARKNLVDLMRKISWRDSIEIINLWRTLYKEFSLRYNVNLKIEAKKRNMSKADYADKFGYMEHLYGLAIEMFL